MIYVLAVLAALWIAWSLFVGYTVASVHGPMSGLIAIVSWPLGLALSVYDELAYRWRVRNE